MKVFRLKQSLDKKPAQTTLKAYLSENKDFKTNLWECKLIIEEEHARYLDH